MTLCNDPIGHYFGKQNFKNILGPMSPLEGPDAARTVVPHWGNGSQSRIGNTKCQ